MAKLKPKEKPHYVNNRDFSEAVYDYAKSALEARTNDTTLPGRFEHLRCVVLFPAPFGVRDSD